MNEPPAASGSSSGAVKAFALSSTLLCAFLPGLAQQPAPQAGPATTMGEAAVSSISQGRALLRAGHFQEAEQMFRRQLALDPHSAETHAALAYCLLRENQAAAALEEYTLASAIRPPTAQELTEVGQAYVLLGDDADADHWTLRAVRLNPNDPEAWYSLGRIRYTEQRFADAKTCFEHVLSLRPHNVKAENNLGLAEEGTNNTEAAMAAYRQAIAWESDPVIAGDEQPYLNLAIVLLHRGTLAEAQPLLNRAAAISPHDPRIFEQLGHLHLQQGDAGEAAAAFSEAVRLDPKNGGLHFLLGQSLRRLGQKDQAQAEFATAARLSSTSVNAKKP